MFTSGNYFRISYSENVNMLQQNSIPRIKLRFVKVASEQPFDVNYLFNKSNITCFTHNYLRVSEWIMSGH